MSNINFTVAACTQTKENKFVWKLHVIHSAEAFGIVKEIKRTYYIGGMPKELPVGTVIADTLDKFKIVERPCAVITDPRHTDAGKVMDEAAAKKLGMEYKVINLSWLHLKVA
jgi:hypothetical protein